MVEFEWKLKLGLELKQKFAPKFLRGEHIILRMCKRSNALLHYHHLLCLVQWVRTQFVEIDSVSAKVAFAVTAIPIQIICSFS